jgi:hypothetical protein
MRSEIRLDWRTMLDGHSLERAPPHRTSKRHRTAFRNQGNRMKENAGRFSNRSISRLVAAELKQGTAS